MLTPPQGKLCLIFSNKLLSICWNYFFSQSRHPLLKCNSSPSGKSHGCEGSFLREFVFTGWRWDLVYSKLPADCLLECHKSESLKKGDHFFNIQRMHSKSRHADRTSGKTHKELGPCWEYSVSSCWTLTTTAYSSYFPEVTLLMQHVNFLIFLHDEFHRRNAGSNNWASSMPLLVMICEHFLVFGHIKVVLWLESPCSLYPLRVRSSVCGTFLRLSAKCHVAK